MPIDNPYRTGGQTTSLSSNMQSPTMKKKCCTVSSIARMLIYIIGVGVIVILIIRKANSDVDQGSIDVSHQLRGVYVSPAVKSSLNSVDQDADSSIVKPNTISVEPSVIVEKKTSIALTSSPTLQPTEKPTERPTKKPTFEPTIRPTTTPTLMPSLHTIDALKETKTKIKRNGKYAPQQQPLTEEDKILLSVPLNEKPLVVASSTNKYDLKTYQAKDIQMKVVEQNKAETVKPSVQTCEGNNDPFIDIPPDIFVPPKNTPSTTMRRWKTEVAASVSRISRLKIGGPELQKTIGKEVAALESLRLELFCSLIESSEGKN